MQYAADREIICSHRYDLGADYWTTPDNRLANGSPFSLLESVNYLLELGVEPSDPILKGAADILFSGWKEDGRFRIHPTGSLYPCQTAPVAAMLARMGYTHDFRLQKTFSQLLSTRYQDGGWRCNKFFFGRGPETECSNPLPTLNALHAFRYASYANNEISLNSAVEFLLEHWRIRKPIGPCHYGIGTLFMQVEYPFRTYNLFFYVYVLSFYDYAKKDERFLEALAVLKSKMQDGKIVVERVAPKLRELSFCQKGKPSELATLRYREILANLEE